MRKKKLGTCTSLEKACLRICKKRPTGLRNPPSRVLLMRKKKIGGMYWTGEGIAKDLKKSAYWTEKAAEQGDANAQFSTALTYYSGFKDGVPKNLQKAAYWFEKSAEQGDIDAQHYMGLMYLNGEGVTKDFKKAAYWIKKAMVGGHKVAQENWNRYELWRY